VRYRDSLVSGSYSVAVPGDTAAVPAAIVAVRYFIRDTAHAFVLDTAPSSCGARTAKWSSYRGLGTRERDSHAGAHRVSRRPAAGRHRDVRLRAMTESADVRVGFIGRDLPAACNCRALHWFLVPSQRDRERPPRQCAGRCARLRDTARLGDGAELARSPDVDLVVVSSTPDSHAATPSRRSRLGSTCCAKSRCDRRV